MTIIQLSDVLANKIAAGEVVERPSSVVKELIENSIDAKSTWIKIDVKEAGLQMIKVTDNGQGMSTVDCEIAFSRHATSKIKYEQDLFHIKTLGFRGEALASISAVSKLDVKSSQGNEAGTHLRFEGGKLIERLKSDARRGTEVCVRDLFYNTPARLKYVKTIHTELGHITDLVNRLALAHPTIRFELSHNGNSLLQTTGSGQLLQVIKQVYGMKIAEQMIEVSTETLDYRVTGYISKPELTRANRSYVSTIVNGRYIRNIGLARAIAEGYDTLLPIHRHPVVILNIEMDPILIDVNVHPTKLEVRFSKENELFTAVREMIKQTFRSKTLIPEMSHEQVKRRQSHSQPSEHLHMQSFIDEQPREDVNKYTHTQADEQFLHKVEHVNETENDTRKEYVSKNEAAPVSDRDRMPVLYPIGQLLGTYILAQNDHGFYMIDQHAAQERIKYESYRQKLRQNESTNQQLLLPIMIECTHKEALYIEKHQDVLESIGLYLESFGQHTYAVRSHPTWFPKGEEKEIIEEMIEQILKEQTINIGNIREEVAILMACKGSIKANQYLTKNDMESLLLQLREMEDPFTCPHGRPVIVHFSTYEIEKMFKRIM
ncbi:MAG TPA: DNA mismatch repair endonuclease MutL [Bacillota bacterium]|nr:DNA mismatch repair endonuclease MutL [Bacillota bacterium]